MQSLVQTLIRSNEVSLNEIFTRPQTIHTFLNPVSYLRARQIEEIYKNFDFIHADGSHLVMAIYQLYSKRVERRSFDMTSIAPKLFQYAQKHEKTLYLIGALDGEIERAIESIKNDYPEIKIAGYRHGYIKDVEEELMIMKEIISLKPDFLIVGMGAIKQELFLLQIKKFGFTGIGFTCGGFLHQTSIKKNYYPQWFDKRNLRFLYRMYKEKHTRKRYLKAAFLFPIYFIKDGLFSSGKKGVTVESRT